MRKVERIALVTVALVGINAIGLAKAKKIRKEIGEPIRDAFDTEAYSERYNLH